MSYLAKVLRPGEALLFRATLHWLIYAPGLCVASLGLALLILALVAGSGAGVPLAVIAMVVLLFSAAMLLVEGVRRSTTEIVVTDRRVIYKTGLISRRTMEMNTSKIETVDVEQGIAARLLGFGTVLIRGTGSTFEPLVKVTDPLALRNAILVG